jgi:hypothetical protein
MCRESEQLLDLHDALPPFGRGPSTSEDVEIVPDDATSP